MDARMLRHALRKSQADIGRLARVSQTTVSRFENGSKSVSDQTAQAILAVLVAESVRTTSPSMAPARKPDAAQIRA